MEVKPVRLILTNLLHNFAVEFERVGKNIPVVLFMSVSPGSPSEVMVASTMQMKEYIAVPSEDNEGSVTFQAAMKVTISLGQFFGLNPVIGICEEDASKVRFTYWSGRCVYTMVSVAGQAILLCFCLLKIFWESDASLNSNSTVVFYASNSLITILFLRLAKKWPKLSRQIAKVEELDPNMDRKLTWKCNITCISFFVLGVVEHGLSDLSGISAAIHCSPEKHPYEAFLTKAFYWIWVYIPYHTFLGILAKFFCIQCTFNYNYSDIFIMCICWYLDARLQQINNRLNDVIDKVAPPIFWSTVREDYTKTTTLVRKIDHLISGIIFVSLFTNLFIICFLLLQTLDNGLNPLILCDVQPDDRLLNGYEHLVYYFVAIMSLIVRSLVMCLLAAKVNSTSNQTAIALYDVPSDAFNDEVQRFIDQVHSDTIVLSGLQFFSVKRGMVLTIAAAIVTYELVLIQFTGVDTSPTK